MNFTMKKSLKYISFIVAGIIIVLLIVVNYSAVESNYQCTGQASNNGNTKPLTIFIKLTEYRW